MTTFEYQRDTKQDVVRTVDLDQHNQLRRAFPFWVSGLVPGAKHVGDVIEAMIRTENSHLHNALPQDVWELRRQRAGWMNDDITFAITDEMRESVQNAAMNGEFPGATLDDIFLYLTPPYSTELNDWLNACSGEVI